MIDWHRVIGDRSGDCLILKTRYGMVRIELTEDHRGRLYMTYGSSEGMFLGLNDAIEKAASELALRAQEQE
jgi:hypothetical protein